MRLMTRSLGAVLARGLAAGVIGTAVMTVAQGIEMKLRNRPASTTPARAVERVLGIALDETSEARLSWLVHFAYGTGWGLPRAVLRELGARGASASTMHLLLVWGTALSMLPRLGVAPPVREWSRTQRIDDLAQHAIYAWATGAALDWLAGRAERAQ
jgi:hypothetical protein